ncbi:unnamed protein product [Vitrella brassicaformis CCMP3155]|uniref:C-CAP/cofactor C-like domain-containing protein n=1 Tax=Vitrella brassicaformis (strain CCMP3155) TaxID=1169540 RepID=A0A0G4EGJ3_VITBC|nr:unnamed protein product [Vitrella brassicaformis CCMP3155]|eukprot:CEL94578.1 unnamed protein product [Vitrella brassicaformis CCMP3155]
MEPEKTSQLQDLQDVVGRLEGIARSLEAYRDSVVRDAPSPALLRAESNAAATVSESRAPGQSAGILTTSMAPSPLPSVHHRPSATGELPDFVKEFDELKGRWLPDIEGKASAVGDQLSKLSDIYCRHIAMLRALLVGVATCHDPEDKKGIIFAPFIEAAREVKAFEHGPLDLHQKVVGEALSALSFVWSPNPSEHIQTFYEAANFHSIKILKLKDPTQTAWVKAVEGVLLDLKKWAIAHFKTGVSWNKTGMDPLLYFQMCPPDKDNDNGLSFQAIIPEASPALSASPDPATPSPSPALAALSPPAGPTAGRQGYTDRKVAAYRQMVEESILLLGALAEATGIKDVKEGTAALVRGFGYLGAVFEGALVCRKPKDDEIQGIFQPFISVGKDLASRCDNRSDYFPHQKFVAEAFNVFTCIWTPAPGDHVQMCIETADFHGNKVLKLKQDAQSSWVKGVKGGLNALKAFLSEYYKTGLTWNPQGSDPVRYFQNHPLDKAKPTGGVAVPPPTPAPSLAPSTAPPARPGKAAPPRPPPPRQTPPKIVPVEQPKAPGGGGGGGGLTAVLGELKTFSTTGLRHVTDDMKTKNRTDRKAVVPAKEAKDVGQTAANGGKADARPIKPTRCEIERENWIVENYIDFPGVFVLDEATMKQSVYIANCHKSTIQVKGKVKSISIDRCKRTSVVIQDAISVAEVVNSENVNIQVMGRVPSVAIDKCTGVHLYMSRASKAVEIVSSKSSEMTVSFPKEGHDDLDLVELPVPEQFVSRIVGDRVETRVSDLYSS